MSNFAVNPYTLYKIRTEKGEKPPTNSPYNPVSGRRARRNSISTTLVKALIARRFGK